MDESRKAFEEWALEVMQFTPDELTWDERRNCYRDYVPHMAWKGWQASRAAIEIEPISHYQAVNSIPSSKTSIIEAVKIGYLMCAESAGIKVKE